VVSAVAAVVGAGVADIQQLDWNRDIPRLEEALRVALAAQQAQWVEDYSQLLYLQYAQEEFLREELQVMWLLFEM
jgi:hypothetical protein